MNVHQYHPDDIVDTAIGPMRVGDMTKRLSDWDNDHECGCAREFWYKGQMVKRDVSIQLKVPGVEGKGLLSRFGRSLRKLFTRSQPSPQENLS